MEFRNGEEPTKEATTRNEESKVETERPYFGCSAEPEESEFKNVHNQPKDGAVAPKPGDVRNGDLVSLLLAATPPYLYNIPLVPQTFFFSEMLKSFVQAKTDRQNFKAQQGHHRRQRKRSWREATPPKSMGYEARDKPLELTTTRQAEEKGKPDKVPVKKFQGDTSEKKYQTSELASSNFSVEKLANSSIATGAETNNVTITTGEVLPLPPAPPLWYPLLYPPHPPYGIDPLHFFIDLRVSAHFWDRKLASEKTKKEIGLAPMVDPIDTGGAASTGDPPQLGTAGRHNSAFRVPPATKEASFSKGPKKKNTQNVHYVITSLRNIYKALDEREKEEENEKAKEEEEEEEEEKKDGDEKKCKDLRALIGLELVVDYVKHESDGEDDKSDDVGNQGTLRLDNSCSFEEQ